ncbi:hypothetical protein [Streptomyces sp. NPDC002559]
MTNYPPHVEAVIKSDADVWFRGNVESSREMFTSHVEQARRRTPEQRARAISDAWYANDLIKAAAYRYVDDPDNI